ncbi:putative membrane protein [Paenibacillus castaneae]|uniref:DUF5808 domain-containing protein n=1 Tax=Paenibacillus castaneae TaxID=474957 RepID=UPI000C9C147E|nr:DUF5808 domain-containing protein [Paenibacillus castaneae]NIK80399.1 putative membrane protein [Paenibacillus castaneae]
MYTLVLIIPVLITYILVLATFLNLSKPNNNIIFGVIFPEKVLHRAEIKQLQADYKKSYTLYGVLILVTLIPFFLLVNYFSLAFIYTFIWFVAFIYTSKLPFHNIHHKATALKRENEWFVGEKRLISIESKVNTLKNAKIVSRFWFLIPALISLVPLILSIQDDNILLTMTGFASLAMTVILFVIYFFFANMKSKVYSKNQDINEALNLASKRIWSILWVGMAIFESLNAIVAYSILTMGNSSSFTYWIIGIVMVSLVPLASIFYVHNKVRDLEESLAYTDGHDRLADEDAYWLNGSVYYNPDDKSIMVPKRVGMGSTINMATPMGKWIQYGSLVLVLAIVIPVGAFIIQSDNTSPSLTIDESNIVSIDYPLYDYSFPVEEIEEITLEDSIPSGFRTNGIATSEYARGSFSMDKLGDTKLYIFKNSPPYLFIKINGSYVIYNEKEPLKTLALYNNLTKLMAK